MSLTEQHRLQALLAQGLLDTPSEERFDRITRMAAARFGAPMACVTLIDSDRQWFKSRVGIDDASTDRRDAFCDHTIRGEADSIMVVGDATIDPRFADNPFVTGEAHVRFYAGANLTTADGANLGALCVIDTEPRPDLTSTDREHLRALADMVMDQIELTRIRKELDERARQLDLGEALSRTGNWTLNVDTGAVYWSPQVYVIHGVTPETFNPTLGDALAFYVEADRTRITQLIQEQSQRGEGWEFDATLVRADGSRRLVRSAAECQRDATGRVTGFFGVFKDLTDERQSMERAIEQERRYRILADNISDIIAVYDSKGVFSYISPAIKHLMGYEPADLIGRTPEFFIIPEDHVKIRKAFAEAYASDKPLTVEYRARTADGLIRWLEARPRFHKNDKGELIEIHDCVRDVTERHTREQALQQAQADAEQAAQAKAAFLANMSHEIRTPLHGVIGFAEVLSGSDLDDDQRRYVDRIRSAGRGLSALVDDILDVSKIDAGKMTVERCSYDLHALCEEVVDLTRSANGDRLVFAMRWDHAIGQHVLGDEQRVRQVLMNLLGNAAKFTREGSIQLAVRLRGDAIELRVIDTGVGIAPEALEHLFEEFTQADPSVSRSFGGTGLGLSISRSLARLMGGDVRLESRVDQGTTAFVTLPHEPVGAVASAQDAPALVPDERSPLRLLVVDDVEANLELLSLMLNAGGHRVVTAASGQTALDILAGDDAFDLVLMDLQMPGMDGIETTRRLRQIHGSRPPVVAVTANVLPDQILACREAGMDGHLAKPVRAETLAETLEKHGRAAPLPPSQAELAEAMADLKVRYGAQMQALAVDLRAMADLPPTQRQSAVVDLAHAMAGTSGSLGYKAVSQAAFALEAAARETPDLDAPIEGLLGAIAHAATDRRR